MMSSGERTAGGGRLRTGMAAPSFGVIDAFGQPVMLEGYRGGSILLSFYRYASCPLCNLRVHELVAHHDEWRERGLHLLAVFESPAEHIRRYLDRHDAPFPILPDPERRLYRQYGVQPSWGGLLRVMTHHFPMVYEAVVRKGFLPGRMDGDWAMVPADFLIGPDLRIAEAFYGRHIGDHMPVTQIRQYLDRTSGYEDHLAPLTQPGE